MQVQLKKHSLYYVWGNLPFWTTPPAMPFFPLFWLTPYHSLGYFHYCILFIYNNRFTYEIFLYIYTIFVHVYPFLLYLLLSHSSPSSLISTLIYFFKKSRLCTCEKTQVMQYSGYWLSPHPFRDTFMLILSRPPYPGPWFLPLLTLQSSCGFQAFFFAPYSFLSTLEKICSPSIKSFSCLV